MSRRVRPQPRNRRRQVNLLQTTARKSHSRQQLTRALVWTGGVTAGLVATGIALHFGLSWLLDRVLYRNDHYTLNQIQVEPRGRFSVRSISQAAGLERGENLWTLDLAQMARDIDRLPYVASARVERHFPDRIVIRIRERVPLVRISGANADRGAAGTFYLDREGIVLQPRDNEAVPQLPEVTGLKNADLEPGARLDAPALGTALDLLQAIDRSPLHTTLDIRAIDLGQPLSITFATAGGMAVTFRPDHIDEQIVRLKQIVDYAEGRQRAIRTVDLTPDCNVPVNFYP